MVSGPNQVEIGSKSGPEQVRAEGFGWVGARGVGKAFSPKRGPIFTVNGAAPPPPNSS